MRSNPRTVPSRFGPSLCPVEQSRRKNSEAEAPTQGGSPEAHHENPFTLKTTQGAEKLLMILEPVLSGFKNFALCVRDYTSFLMKSNAIDLKGGDKVPHGSVSDL